MNSTDYKKQIWQVIDSRGFGGIESHIFYLSSALAEKGRNVCVVFLNDYGTHPLEAKFQEENIQYIKCKGPFDFLKLARILFKSN